MASYCAKGLSEAPPCAAGREVDDQRLTETTAIVHGLCAPMLPPSYVLPGRNAMCCQPRGQG